MRVDNSQDICPDRELDDTTPLNGLPHVWEPEGLRQMICSYCGTPYKSTWVPPDVIVADQERGM